MPAWFLKTATAIESMKFGQQEVWNNIHDLQTASRGLVQIKTLCSVRKLDGTICSSAGEQQQRWREHFLKVLNIQSTFDPAEIEFLRVRDVSEGLAIPCTADEVQTAINHLSNGKAAGSSSILPEMVKVNCNLFYQRLFTLIRTVWDAGVVPQDWVDAEIVPIPKKGDLSHCDNWRGIALLDVVGKVFGRVLQSRLQQLPGVLPETQCGFRHGRSCTDMIFIVRQIIEKCYEHRSKAFLVFVDLRKAYDSVTWATLWLVLRKLGVPDHLVQLLQSFHDNMDGHHHRQRVSCGWHPCLQWSLTGLHHGSRLV